MPVASSNAITTLAEAKEYYQQKLVGKHKITSRGNPVAIVFEAIDTHIYSEDVDDINAIPPDQLVTRNRGGGKRECRQFSLDRATLMDQILPAISDYKSCGGGNGGSRATRVLHGPQTPCGRHMRVVLRPGSDGSSWFIVSAFPVDVHEYRRTTFGKQATFP